MVEPIVNEEPVIEAPKPAEAVVEAEPKPGEKTDPALLLASLQKEREEKRQERDARLKAEQDLETERLKNTQSQGEVFSEEGKILLKQIEEVKSVVVNREQRELLSSLQTTYPALKDKSAEFEQYRTDNPGMKLETAAKAFLVENELLETSQPRKGLESAQGGGRTPVQTGMTPEEIDNLRINDYNEYARRIRAGTLK